MTLEEYIKEIVSAGVREALARDLPAHLARFEQPVDPDKCRSIKATAEYLGVTVSCVRERISEGRLQAIKLGKYVVIPHRSVQALIASELDRERFARQAPASCVVSDMDDEINEALDLVPSE